MPKATARAATGQGQAAGCLFSWPAGDATQANNSSRAPRGRRLRACDDAAFHPPFRIIKMPAEQRQRQRRALPSRQKPRPPNPERVDPPKTICLPGSENRRSCFGSQISIMFHQLTCSCGLVSVFRTGCLQLDSWFHLSSLHAWCQEYDQDAASASLSLSC